MFSKAPNMSLGKSVQLFRRRFVMHQEVLRTPRNVFETFERGVKNVRFYERVQASGKIVFCTSQKNAGHSH